MIKTALIRWNGASRFTGETSSGYQIAMDSDRGGTAARPTELPLVGLGGCTGMDVVDILRKKRQEVETYEVLVEAQQREEHPKIFTTVVVEHRLAGNGLDPAAVARAIELSATKYCTVSAIMAAGLARIEHRYVVRNLYGEHRGQVVVTGPGGANISNVQPVSRGTGEQGNR
jgi:putative redox protein